MRRYPTLWRRSDPVRRLRRILLWILATAPFWLPLALVLLGVDMSIPV